MNMVTCDGDGEWGDAVWCDNGCAGNACNVCVPYTSECVGTAQVRYCDADGNWGITETCGIACENGSSPTIRKNIITGNLADGLISTGGGIWCNLGSSPLIEDNTIFLNVAVLAGGGIACNVDSNPTISGNSIWGNIVTLSGGGISCAAASPAITNNFIYEHIRGR